MKLSNKIKLAILSLPLLGGAGEGLLSSCTKLDSSLVQYVEDNKLNTPNDTLYSFIGVLSKMQKIVDRNIIFGELKGDLTSLTSSAQLNLQEIANFTAGTDNPYNNISDYYAIIQNCNYYIANADTALMKRGQKVFEREFAVIKAYRAWTYLQLAQNYGKVPFVTEPILAEKDSDPSLYPLYDAQQIAEYFIKDLAPYVDTKIPEYGAMGSFDSRKFYIPIRVLLGELCLWSGNYKDAAKYYHDFLTNTNQNYPTYINYAFWDTNWERVGSSYIGSLGTTSELLTFIPMEEEEYDGEVSRLEDVFSSTEDNNYFYQATYSPALLSLSQSQVYVQERVNTSTQQRDTLFYPEDLAYESDILRGDLRLSQTFSFRTASSSDTELARDRQTNQKYITTTGLVVLYRLQNIYLRYAEALNRAGFPETAFAVLKYGLSPELLSRTDAEGKTIYYINERERNEIGTLATFSAATFTRSNTQGIHSRGSGDSHANYKYVIPECPTRQDSILAVENLICDEMALETASEGNRFYDLVRISKHRNDPKFLANKVARRNNTLDSQLFERLSKEENWYLTY